MQFIEEHQEIPKRETAVMLVGEPRKWHGICNLAAGHRHKRKKRTQGNSGSNRKLAAACRRVSHCAIVAWQKRNIRKILIQASCGLRKELAVACTEMTHHAEVAQRRGHDRKRYDRTI
jgi:hypothetical protein